MTDLPPMTGAALSALMAATWPAASQYDLGPFRLRDGAGGGKRVSAASCEGDWTAADLDRAEAAMAERLFVIFPGDEVLDAELARRGYQIIDPVVAYAAPVAALADAAALRFAYPHWEPLQITREIWAEGGIGPARVAVMSRVTGAKCAILGRGGDSAVGAAFVACHGRTAMLHALEVRPAARRQGVAARMLAAAAHWAAEQGADALSLVVTERNLAARSLYDRAGMSLVGQYHYRIASPE